MPVKRLAFFGSLKTMFYKTQLTKNLKLLEVFNFFGYLTFFTAVAIIYFSQVAGSYALGISIFSISQIAKAMLEVPSGIFSDTWGRKKCLVVGAVFSLLSVLFFAFGKSYLFLAIGAVFQGACYAFYSGNNDAFLYETLLGLKAKEKYQGYLGKTRSNMEMSFFVGGIMGGIISWWSFPLIMWLSIIPQLVALIIGLKLTEPRTRQQKEIDLVIHLKDVVRLFRSNIQLRRLSLIGIIGNGIGESSWHLVAAFYNSLIPTWLVSFMVSLNFLISTIGYRLSGNVLKRFKAVKLLITQEVFSRFINIIALWFPTVLSPFLMVFASVLYGPGEVAKNNLFQIEFTSKQRATLSSVISFLGSCLFVVWAMIIGIMADKFGTAKALLATQFCLIPILWVYFKYARGVKAGARQRFET